MSITSEQAAMQTLAKNLEKRFKKLRKKDSVKNVHATRVALRHIDALVSVFPEPAAEALEHKNLLSWIKKIRKALGKVRDIDVALDMVQEIGVEDKKFLDELAARRKKFAGKLLAQLDSDRTRKSLKRLAKVTRKVYEEKVCLNIPIVVQDEQQLIGADANHAESSEQMHKVRIRMKKLRYLKEDLVGVADEELAGLQDKLGKLHDVEALLELVSNESDDDAKAKELSEERERLWIEAKAAVGKFSEQLEMGQAS